MNNFYRKIIPLAILIGFFLFIANLLIDNPYTHRLARVLINEKLKTVTALSVDFKAIKVSLLPLGADLYGFTVSAGSEKQDILISASHLQGRVSLWSLVLGSPKLGSLLADDLEFSWPISDQAMRLLGLEAKPSAKATPITWPPALESLPIEELILKNARIYFALPPDKKDGANTASPLTVSLSGMDCYIYIDAIDQISAELDIQNVNLKSYDRSVLTDARFISELNFYRDRLNNSNFQITSPIANFKGAIDLKLNTQPKNNLLSSVDLVLKPVGEGDLTILGTMLDIDKTEGKVKADAILNFHIPVESKDEFGFSVKGNAKAQDAKIGDFLLYNTDTDLEIDLEKIVFKNAKIKIGENDHGSAEGELYFNNAIDFAFKGRPKDLPLSKILHLVGVEFDAVDTDLSSQNLVITGKGDPFSMSVKANADLTHLSFKDLKSETTMLPPPTCSLQMNLDINSKRIVFDDSQGFCFFMGEPSTEQMVQIEANRPAIPANAHAVSKIDFSGLANFSDSAGMNLQIHSSELQMKLMSAYVPAEISGQAMITTQIFGPYKNIVVANTIKAKNVSYANAPLDKVEGKIFLKKNAQLQWSNLKITPLSGGYFLSPQGTLELGQKNLHLSTEMQGKNIDKATLKPILALMDMEQDLSFDIASIEANLQGPLTAPFAYTGNLNLVVENFQLGETLIFNQAKGEISLTDDKISTSDLVVNLGDFYTSTSLKYLRKYNFNFADAAHSQNIWYRLGLNPKDHVEIQSNAFVPTRRKRSQEKGGYTNSTGNGGNHLQSLPYIGAHFKDFKINSRVYYKASLQGTIDNLQGTFTTKLYDLTLFDVPIAPLNSETVISQNNLDIIFHHGGSALEGRVKIQHREANLPYTAYVQAKRFDLRFLASSLFATDPRNFVYLTADWKAQGNLTQFWQSTGDLNVHDLQVQYVRDMGSEVRNIFLNLNDPITIATENGYWNIKDQKQLILNGQNFHIKISTVNNHMPNNLGLYFEGVVNLTLLRTLFPQVETASGKMRFKGSVTKTLANPDITFEFQDVKSNVFTQSSWEPVVIGIADIRPAFSQIEFKIRLENRKVIIDALTATKGKGRLSATGNLILFDETSTEDSRINLEFNEISVNYPVAVFKSFDSLLSGNLTINGKTKPYAVSGAVRVDRARSTSNFDIRKEIIDALQRRPFYSPMVVEEAFFKLDIQAIANQSISIRNQNVQTVLSTNLKIEGSENSPAVLGQMEIAQGKFVYKREFRVSQGLMTFDNPVTPDPRLDILAVSEVSGYNVYVAITGRGSDPKVDLSVDPPTKPDGTAMTKVDILLLLSTGSPPTSQGRQFSTENVATSEALNILAGQFEEPVEKLFDLSGQKVVRQIYIDTYSDPAKKGQPTARVNLPLNVHEDWDVIFGVDEQTNWRVSVGYDIHQSISVTGSYERVKENESLEDQTPTDTGVDLKFQFAFP